MKKSEERRIKRFVEYLFKKNKEFVSVNITVTHKKKKSKYTRSQIGNKISGLSFRRQDFALVSEGVKNG